MVLPTLVGARCHLTLPYSVAITEVMERGADQGRRMATLGKVNRRANKKPQKRGSTWVRMVRES